ncbi:MAG: tRNA uridine-5-carboxymethylaminomethyl(34) synthesis GTPase MnmE [bacterium]
MTADTIAAVATPPGKGGVGIIRVSGTRSLEIAREIAGRNLAPRQATLASFLDAEGQIIDQGILLYFPAPHSFTGEHVVELQGHGGPVVMDMLLQRCVQLGARLARPGEFSERAFLNDKLDLAQAEAIADLIESDTETAARLAYRSLQGEFSARIHALVEEMIRLRMYVEAAIDFPEEEIDFLSDGKVSTDLLLIIDNTKKIRDSARTGRLLRDGMKVVIAGSPNAGKSSLMNSLAGVETAIVTAQAGTTRDVLRERIQIDGMPLHLVDTAGIREAADVIEQEGVKRAHQEIADADALLWVYDAESNPNHADFDADLVPANVPVVLVRNKIDLVEESSTIETGGKYVQIHISAKAGEGIDLLKTHLKTLMGYQGSEDAEFIARRRHLDAIDRASEALDRGRAVLLGANAGELLAEELRQSQQALSEITGEFSADDLLGEIFSNFCIGK